MLLSPHDIWATDLIIISLRRGYLCLVAIIDFYSRHIISCMLSNRLDTEFCLDALETELASGPRRRIFYSDQLVVAQSFQMLAATYLHSDIFNDSASKAGSQILSMITL